jgi:hypothetical protein
MMTPLLSRTVWVRALDPDGASEVRRLAGWNRGVTP